jgi:hypothetical protein
VAIRRCPYCKAIIDESQKYCNNCGTQLLFPEDDSNEEPIKGEKILDDDFKDEPENKGFDEPADDLGIEREEIDLEAVLKGSGHFPGESADALRPAGRDNGSVPSAAGPPAPSPKAEPEEPSGARRPPRSRKKPDSAVPKSDTREEIARLIAALEEKEKKSVEPPELPIRDDIPGPGLEAKKNLDTPLDKPEPRDKAVEIPTLVSASEPPSWENLLEKPATTDLENGPLPGAFAPAEDIEADEPPAIEGPSANPAAGDTMDFEQEVFRRTPPSVPSPTQMGIPEGVTGESALLPRLDGEEELPREEIRRTLYEKEIPAAVPAAAGPPEEEAAPRRLGFFRKIGALFFDIIFIAAICLASLWLAARLMDVALFDLVSLARVATALYFLALLFGYFFLFLFFLGETLGDRMASPRS